MAIDNTTYQIDLTVAGIKEALKELTKFQKQMKALLSPDLAGRLKKLKAEVAKENAIFKKSYEARLEDEKKTLEQVKSSLKEQSQAVKQSLNVLTTLTNKAGKDAADAYKVSHRQTVQSKLELEKKVKAIKSKIANYTKKLQDGSYRNEKATTEKEIELSKVKKLKKIADLKDLISKEKTNLKNLTQKKIQLNKQASEEEKKSLAEIKRSRDHLTDEFNSQLKEIRKLDKEGANDRINRAYKIANIKEEELRKFLLDEKKAFFLSKKEEEALFQYKRNVVKKELQLHIDQIKDRLSADKTASKKAVDLANKETNKRLGAYAKLDKKQKEMIDAQVKTVANLIKQKSKLDFRRTADKKKFAEIELKLQEKLSRELVQKEKEANKLKVNEVKKSISNEINERKILSSALNIRKIAEIENEIREEKHALLKRLNFHKQNAEVQKSLMKEVQNFEKNLLSQRIKEEQNKIKRISAEEKTSSEAQIKRSKREYDESERIVKTLTYKEIQRFKDKAKRERDRLENRTDYERLSAKERLAVRKKYDDFEYQHYKKMVDDKIREKKKETADKEREDKKALANFKKSFKQQVNFAKKGIKALGGFASAGMSVISGAFSQATMQLQMFAQQMLEVGVEFDKVITTLAAIRGVARANIGPLEDQARMLGATTLYTATQAADGMQALARAGLDVSQVIAASGDSLKFAGANATTMYQSTSLLAATMKQFSIQAGQSSRIVDTFTSSTQNSMFDVESLAVAMRYAGNVGSGMGAELEETVAVLSQFRDMGLEGSMVGTRFRQSMLRLSAPTIKAKKAMDKLGISYDSINPSKAGLIGALKELARLNLEQEQLVPIVGSKVVADFNKLIQGIRNTGEVLADGSIQEGTSALEQFVEKLYQSRGVTEKTYKMMIESVSGQIDILKSQTQELQLSIFDVLSGKAAADQGVQQLTTLTGVIKIAQQVVTDLTIVFKELNLELSALIENEFGEFFGVLKDGASGFAGTIMVVLVQLSQLIAYFISWIPTIVTIASILGSMFVGFAIGTFINQIVIAAGGLVMMAKAATGAAMSLKTLDLATTTTLIGLLVKAVVGLVAAFVGFDYINDKFDEITERAKLLENRIQAVRIAQSLLDQKNKDTVGGLTEQKGAINSLLIALDEKNKLTGSLKSNLIDLRNLDKERAANLVKEGKLFETVGLNGETMFLNQYTAMQLAEIGRKNLQNADKKSAHFYQNLINQEQHMIEYGKQLKAETAIVERTFLEEDLERTREKIRKQKESNLLSQSENNLIVALAASYKEMFRQSKERKLLELPPYTEQAKVINADMEKIQKEIENTHEAYKGYIKETENVTVKTRQGTKTEQLVTTAVFIDDEDAKQKIADLGKELESKLNELLSLPEIRVGVNEADLKGFREQMSQITAEFQGLKLDTDAGSKTFGKYIDTGALPNAERQLELLKEAKKVQDQIRQSSGKVLDETEFMKSSKTFEGFINLLQNAEGLPNPFGEDWGNIPKDLEKSKQIYLAVVDEIRKEVALEEEIKISPSLNLKDVSKLSTDLDAYWETFGALNAKFEQKYQQKLEAKKADLRLSRTGKIQRGAKERKEDYQAEVDAYQEAMDELSDVDFKGSKKAIEGLMPLINMLDKLNKDDLIPEIDLEASDAELETMAENLGITIEELKTVGKLRSTLTTMITDLKGVKDGTTDIVKIASSVNEEDFKGLADLGKIFSKMLGDMSVQSGKFQAEIDTTKVDAELDKTKDKTKGLSDKIKALIKDLQELKEESLDMIATLQDEVDVLKDASKEGVKALKDQADEIIELAEEEAKLTRQLGANAERRMEVFERLNQSISLLMEKTILETAKAYDEAYQSMEESILQLSQTHTSATAQARREQSERFSELETLLNQSYNQRTALIQKELESELLKFENMKKIHRKFRKSRNKANKETAQQAKKYIDDQVNAETIKAKYQEKLTEEAIKLSDKLENARIMAAKEANIKILAASKSHYQELRSQLIAFADEEKGEAYKITQERTKALADELQKNHDHHDQITALFEKEVKTLKEKLDKKIIQQKEYDEKVKHLELKLNSDLERINNDYDRNIETINAIHDTKLAKSQEALGLEIFGIKMSSYNRLVGAQKSANKLFESVEEDGYATSIASQAAYNAKYKKGFIDRNKSISKLIQLDPKDRSSNIDKIHLFMEEELKRKQAELEAQEGIIKTIQKLGLRADSVALKAAENKVNHLKYLIEMIEGELSNVKSIQIDTSLSSLDPEQEAIDLQRELLVIQDKIKESQEEELFIKSLLNAKTNQERRLLMVNNEEKLKSYTSGRLNEKGLTKTQKEELSKRLKQTEDHTKSLITNLTVSKARIGFLTKLEYTADTESITQELKTLKEVLKTQESELKLLPEGVDTKELDKAILYTKIRIQELNEDLTVMDNEDAIVQGFKNKIKVIDKEIIESSTKMDNFRNSQADNLSKIADLEADQESSLKSIENIKKATDLTEEQKKNKIALLELAIETAQEEAKNLDISAKLFETQALAEDKKIKKGYELKKKYEKQIRIVESYNSKLYLTDLEYIQNLMKEYKAEELEINKNLVDENLGLGRTATEAEKKHQQEILNFRKSKIQESLTAIQTYVQQAEKHQKSFASDEIMEKLRQDLLFALAGINKDFEENFPTADGKGLMKDDEAFKRLEGMLDFILEVNEKSAVALAAPFELANFLINDLIENTGTRFAQLGDLLVKTARYAFGIEWVKSVNEAREGTDYGFWEYAFKSIGDGALRMGENVVESFKKMGTAAITGAGKMLKSIPQIQGNLQNIGKLVDELDWSSFSNGVKSAGKVAQIASESGLVGIKTVLYGGLALMQNGVGQGLEKIGLMSQEEFDKTVEGIKKRLKQLVSIFNTVFGTLANGFKTGIDLFNKSVSYMIDTDLSLVSNITNAANAIIEDAEAAKERLKELDDQLAKGEISQAEYDEARSEGVGTASPEKAVDTFITDIVDKAILFMESMAQAAPLVVDKLVSELPRIIEKFKETFPVVLQSLAEGIPQFLSVVIQGVADVLPVIINTLIDTLPNVINNIVSLVETAIIPLIETIAAGISNLIQNIDFAAILGTASRLLKSILEAIGSALTSLMAELPNILGAILSELPNLITMISSVIADLIRGLAEVLPDILKELSKNLPDIVDALIIGAVDIFYALIEMLPVLFTAIFELLPTLVEALAKAIPTLITALIQKAPELIRGIIKQLPSLITALIMAIPRITIALVKLIVQGLPQIAIELVKAIIAELPTLIYELGVGFVDAIGKAITAFIDAIQEFFEGIFDFFKGIFGGDDEEEHDDTPGAIKAPPSGLRAKFKGGDYIIAAQKPTEVIRQALQLAGRTNSAIPFSSDIISQLSNLASNIPRVNLGSEGLFDAINLSGERFQSLNTVKQVMTNMGDKTGFAMRSAMSQAITPLVQSQMTSPSGMAQGMNPIDISVIADGRVLDAVQVSAMDKGNAPRLKRKIRNMSGVNVGFSRGRYNNFSK